MSYELIEAGVSTVIKKIVGFDGDNVSQGDWRILGHGKAKAVVLMPGRFNRIPGTVQNNNQVTWDVEIELYILWDGEQDTTVATLKTQRQAIMDEVNKFRKLDGVSGVMQALVSDGDVVEPFISPNGATFWKQTMICQVLESESFTRSE